MTILIEILKEKKLGKRASLFPAERLASGARTAEWKLRRKNPDRAVGLNQSTMMKAIRRSEASGASAMGRTAQAGPMRRRATRALMRSR
jgi:hypothetical protein